VHQLLCLCSLLSLSRARARASDLRALQLITALLLRCRCVSGADCGGKGRVGAAVRVCRWPGDVARRLAGECCRGARGSHVPTVPRSGARSEPRRCENLLFGDRRTRCRRPRYTGTAATGLPIRSRPIQSVDHFALQLHACLVIGIWPRLI
jgi:hypothetical protein